MVLNIKTDEAFRTPAELAALVKAVFDASADTQETRWIEWKSFLDLEAAEGKFVVAKAILGFANRSPELAALTCEGTAYMVVGAEPGAVRGVPTLDHATVVQKIKPYADGPRWSPHNVPFSGVNVLVIVVEAPRDGDPIHTLRKTYDKFAAGTVFHRGPALTEPAGPNEVAMLGERLLRGARQPDLVLDLSVVAEPLVRLQIDREAAQSWVDRREKYIRSTRRSPAPSAPGLAGMYTMPQPKDREEFDRRVREHLLQCRERLIANLFREVAVSQENKVAFDVGDKTKDPIERVQLTVLLPAQDLGAYAGVPRARPMPQLPAWPDPLDRVRPSSAAIMDSVTESFTYSREDAKVTTRDNEIEITYEIGDLRPGQVMRTPPTTIIVGPAAPEELPITLIGRSMNHRGDTTVSTTLTVSSQHWALDSWLSPETG
jgi:hypothetical protein